MPVKLVLNRYNNYVTDDAAEINFGSKYDLRTKADNFPDGPPMEVEVISAMRSDSDETVPIALNRLTYITSLHGGIRNPDVKFHTYTTSSQSFHLYRLDEEEGEALRCDGPPQFKKPMGLIIVSSNGAGEKWMSIGYSDRGNSILYAVRNLPECIAHDMLKTLFVAYGSGYQHAKTGTTQRYNQAFVDGRLKKRKQRGCANYRVWIENFVPALS